MIYTIYIIILYMYTVTMSTAAMVRCVLEAPRQPDNRHVP